MSRRFIVEHLPPLAPDSLDLETLVHGEPFEAEEADEGLDEAEHEARAWSRARWADDPPPSEAAPPEPAPDASAPPPSPAQLGSVTTRVREEGAAVMNGAEALIGTLADNGVEACFANPGTSEMQFVTALDREPRMRPVLCLFEGVATGAADGYGRMAGKPACTLLHLGPGYGNGLANLHNARRAGTPIVNVVGEHATYHRVHDAPLTSDIAAIVAPNSRWVRSAESADEAATLASEAVQAAYGPPGGPVSLILPADTAWTEASGKGPVLERQSRSFSGDGIEMVAKAVREARKPAVLLGGQATDERGLLAAARLRAAGVRVLADTFLARLPRGAGRFAPDRMLYFGEMAVKDLGGVDLLLLVDTKAPVAFFAYPDKPSVLLPDGCRAETLAAPGEDGPAALEALADALGVPEDQAMGSLFRRPAAPRGELNPYAVGDALARHMPEGTIVSDDSTTAGLPIYTQTRGARPHDWLFLTGGAIGQGIPCAIGAAVACPDRKVVSLNGDGAAMYTVQGLWTMAREGLDVLTVVFANHAYRILNIELARTGAGAPGPSAASLLNLGDPKIDWVSVAKGLGLPAVRCTNAEDFDTQVARAMGERGPAFIEVAL
jgi:acetolactate synthase-1/2/3 large subunit